MGGEGEGEVGEVGEGEGGVGGGCEFSFFFWLFGFFVVFFEGGLRRKGKLYEPMLIIFRGEIRFLG